MSIRPDARTSLAVHDWRHALCTYYQRHAIASILRRRRARRRPCAPCQDQPYMYDYHTLPLHGTTASTPTHALSPSAIPPTTMQQDYQRPIAIDSWPQPPKHSFKALPASTATTAPHTHPPPAASQLANHRQTTGAMHKADRIPQSSIAALLAKIISTWTLISIDRVAKLCVCGAVDQRQRDQVRPAAAAGI